jgi:2-polyprenyl-6-methoxyphenol hydroxylase-like FAD-dependent oxidoreductase
MVNGAMASDAEVLIVGAGIAGLSAARALCLAGRSVEVIERESEWSIEGSGLGLYPNAIRALHALRLAEEVRASGHEVRVARYFDRRGDLLGEVIAPWTGLDQPQIELRRRSLHNALIKGVETPIRMGTTVAQLERSAEGVVVTLSDQTTAFYRLVIGADGVGSTMRALVAPVEARYVGQMFWRGLVEQSCGIDDITVWIAHSRYFGITPVGDGGARWFAQLGVEKPLTSEEGTYERLQEAFADFCEPLPEILKLVDTERQFHCGPAMSVDSPRWYDRGVLLVGDAAHALSPVSGQGAAMAFEDAVVLAEELGGTHDLQSGLAAFERRRRTRIEALRRRVASRIARATRGTDAQSTEPFSPDPWSDQASLLSAPP